MKRYELKVKGMHCASCSTVVERALKKNEFIQNVNVNLTTGKATFEYDETSISIPLIIEIIRSKGYDAEEAEQENSYNGHRQEFLRLRRELLISSVFAVPLFILGMFFMKDPVPYQGYIMWLLSTPVQFYIAKDMYRSTWSALKGKSANMDTLVVMGTSAAYFFSIYLVLSGGHHNYFEASGVLITIVVLGRMLEAGAKGKTSEAIRRLVELRPDTVHIVNEENQYDIPVENVEVGQTVLVKAGEKIPLDGTMLSGETYIDESMLTGESVPVHKKKGDSVFSGTVNGKGVIRFRIDKASDQTMLARVIKLVEDAQGRKAPIQRFADRVAFWFVPAVILIAIATFLAWTFAGKDVGFALINAVSVLVIACPCALGLATPTAIMVGSGKAAQNGILFKSGEALERFSQIKSVIFDKTGTLTVGRPEVTDVYFSDSMTENEFMIICGRIEKDSEHPLAQAVLNRVGKTVHDIPSPDSTEVIAGKGIQISVSGSDYIAGNERLIMERELEWGKFRTLSEKEREKGKTVVHIADSEKVLGLLCVRDEPRKGIHNVISGFKKMGIKVYMLTGDNERTASAIAKEIGIDEVYSELLPHNKSDIVKKLSENSITAMVGDGINDAPSLAVADIGIAMGGGTDVAIESGDVVLMRDEPASLISAYRISGLTVRKIMQNMFWALIYNTLGIPVAAGVLYPFTGWLLNPMFAGGAMALSSVSVVVSSLLLKYKKI